MKIPHKLAVHACVKCKAELSDGEFTRCGYATIPECGVFFDYECKACGFSGRYLLPCEVPVHVALSNLAAMLDANEKQREMVPFDLTKLYGVEDLLRLGGKNAPRETSGKDLNFGCGRK